MTDLTIIIPTYQRPAQTEKAIESVLTQDCDCKLIVVDDGSDPEYELPDHMSGKRITVLRHKENSGPAVARNTGIKAAKTKYVSFLDSDDYLLPGTLQQRLDFALTLGDEPVLVGCSWLDVRPGGNEVIRSPEAAMGTGDYFGGCWFAPGSAVIFPRSVFSKVGMFNSRLMRLEDAEWTMRLGMAGGRFVHHECVGVAVCHNEDKQTQAIEEACTIIKNEVDQQVANGRITHAQYRRVKAYLALERAAAAKRDGRWMFAISEIVRSQFLFPRTRMHTSPGWRYRFPAKTPLS